MSDQVLFEVSDLKQWACCPRIPFYRHCLPEVRPVTALMRAGSASHRDESTREERRSLRAYGLTEGERAFDVWLRSTRLGLRGRLDLAIAVPAREPGAEAIAVDYKDSEQPAGPHFLLQLGAYAMMLEEAWGLPVRRGFIYHIPLRRAEPVSIGAALRRKVAHGLAELQASVASERVPVAPANRRRCVGCEFRRFCNDVV